MYPQLVNVNKFKWRELCSDCLNLVVFLNFMIAFLHVID